MNDMRKLVTRANKAAGRALREERLSRELTQSQVADALGVTSQQVQKYETGKNRISVGVLARLHQAFGMDCAYILAAAIHEARYD